VCSNNICACQNRNHECCIHTHTCRNQGCGNSTYACQNHTQLVELTLALNHARACSHFASSHVVCRNNTCTCQNHTLRHSTCENHTGTCRNHTRLCQNHTLRVKFTLYVYKSHSSKEITQCVSMLHSWLSLLRVKITIVWVEINLMRIEITLMPKSHSVCGNCTICVEITLVRDQFTFCNNTHAWNHTR
jgi:hypothetical protein